MKHFSEYVSLGHPDKTADYISQCLLDRYIKEDPDTRYAVEVQIKNYLVTLGGEVSSKCTLSSLEVRDIVRKAVNDIGYTKEYMMRWGAQNTICGELLEVHNLITQQSSDIAQGVDREGWGDQGIFFGYADPKGPDMCPKDHAIAKALCNKLYIAAQALPELQLGIDIKTQVEMDGDRIEKVIVAIPAGMPDSEEAVRGIVKTHLGWTPLDGPKDPCEIIVNGTGRYVQHGPIADCGTTGRKLVVDFYGGNAPIGGGSPWTKDGSKADLTLNLYARKLARRYARDERAGGQPVLVRLASCIGRSNVAFSVATEDLVIEQGYLELKPSELRKEFKLNTPIYADICKDGLFGGSSELKAWEE